MFRWKQNLQAEWVCLNGPFAISFDGKFYNLRHYSTVVGSFHSSDEAKDAARFVKR